MAVRNLVNKADTARTQDAALGVENDVRTNNFSLATLNFILIHAAVVETKLHIVFLQVALARLVTHGAIERMVDQQEFQDAAYGFPDLFSVGMNHHSFAHTRIASRLEFGHLFHFHQAHAARTGNAETRMIAIPWDFDT